MTRSAASSGVLFLVLSGIGYGVMAPFVRVADSVVPPFTSVALRYALVSLALIAGLALTAQSFGVRPASRRDGVILVMIGLFGAGVSNVLFTLAVLSTTVGNAVFLMSLYTVFTPIMAGMVLREWPAGSQWLAFGVALIGVALLTRFGQAQAGGMVGNLFALVGGLLLSMQYVGTRTVRKYSAATISLYLALGSVACSLPIVLIPGLQDRIIDGLSLDASHATAYTPGLGWLALLAFAATNLSVNLLVSQGFRRVRASFGGVLLLLELPVSLLAALVFFEEWPDPLALIGCGLILAAGAAAVRAEGNRPPQPS